DVVRQLHPQDAGRAVQAPEMRGTLEQVELLPLRVPVRTDALEAPCAVVQRVRHDADVDVVVPRELALVQDPAVGVLWARLHPQLEVGLDANPLAILSGPSDAVRPPMSRSGGAGAPASAITPLWMATLYDIISELRRENPTPSATKTLDLVVTELGQ